MDAVKKVYETTDPLMVAGHRFDNLTDRCVNIKSVSDIYPSGVCCTRRCDMHLATRDDIGKNDTKYHFACVSALNADEYNQIQADIKRVQWARERAYDMIASSAKGE